MIPAATENVYLVAGAIHRLCQWPQEPGICALDSRLQRDALEWGWIRP